VAASRRAPHVIAILGADSFRAEAALGQALEKAGLGASGDDVQVLRGDETNWTRVIDAARTGSLFASRRAVVVRGADQLKGEGEEVIAFMGDPSEEVILVLLAGKADKRKSLWKRIADTATVIDVEPLKGRALQSFVESEVRRRGLKLTADGLTELVDRVGQDLRRLMGEIEKLQAFATGAAALQADDVARVLGRGMARPLYRLSDAMMGKDSATTLLLLEERLDEGEPALRLLATLHRAVRQARAARALVAARASRDEMVSRLGIPPFKAGDVAEAARRWSDDELRKATMALSRADQEMKTGGDPRVALSAAVVAACGLRRPRLAR
jgi:DNA polymerase-3 subunit delta